MNKAPRFMIEYANFQLRKLESNSAMNPGIKRELRRRIGQAVRQYERGYITVDECVRLLAGDRGEDLGKYAS